MVRNVDLVYPEGEKKMKHKTCTYTGKILDFSNPKPEQICIEDIAHALSNICRYTGHTKAFYSVAEHSVRMALDENLSGNPLTRLLHDSAEAYIGDIVLPLQEIFPKKEIENKLLVVISKALGHQIIMTPEVKRSDRIMMVTEVRDLMASNNPIWSPYFDQWTPLSQKIYPWPSDLAESAFLSTYKNLKERIR